MPYPQDLAGKYVRYRVDPGGTLNPAMNAMFVNGVLPGKTTAATVSVDRPTGTAPAPMLGAHRPLPPWSFTFLKYIGGAVTTAPLTTNVLTGPMSGCYLCSYVEGGQTYLAHVGTVNVPDSPESVAVKAAWKHFVARPAVSQVMGGTPFDYFTTGEFQAAMASPSAIPLVCGYFTPGGQAYAIMLAPVPPTGMPNSALNVAAVKQMTLLPWASIAALRVFR